MSKGLKDLLNEDEEDDDDIFGKKISKTQQPAPTTFNKKIN